MRAGTTGRVAAVVLATAALLGGCGGGDGSPEAASTETSEASDRTTTSEAPTTTTTEPRAEGEPFELPTLSGRFPDGWSVVDRTLGSASAGDTDPMTGGFVFVSDLPYLGLETDGFEEVVAVVLRGYENDALRPVRGEDRVVDGVEGWVIEGSNPEEGLVYEWGTIVGGQDIQFTFAFRFPPPDARAIIDSVLASVEWA